MGLAVLVVGAVLLALSQVHYIMRTSQPDKLINETCVLPWLRNLCSLFLLVGSCLFRLWWWWRSEQ